MSAGRRLVGVMERGSGEGAQGRSEGLRGLARLGRPCCVEDPADTPQHCPAPALAAPALAAPATQALTSPLQRAL